ncbi:helix-turn-helix domain-containing protein [Pseudarthrobacter siccitolerans]|uniref:hypothetical protein n=1 Tax=Pseudarthrobacter siccitolerans TaxID=861266 RepID=UPI000B236B5A|nr:hypothetical protein [Pseudarthrobacter siccitolerans]
MRKIYARPEVTRVAPPIPRRAKQISDEQSAQLAAEYRQGMTVGELAEKYGIHRVTVADHLAVHGIEKRLRGLDEAQVLDAATRYHAGSSLAVLGKKYGVSPTTVRKNLVKRGVVMRRSYGYLLSKESLGGELEPPAVVRTPPVELCRSATTSLIIASID